MMRGRNDKDKDEDPSAGSDQGLKKRKTSKDTEPTTGPKKKDSTSRSSKGTKSQPKSTGKFVQLEEPVFEVADSDMPQDPTGNLGDNEDEPRDATASRRDWFKKPKPPQEPTDPDWNVGKTTKEVPTQTTPIDFSSFVLNGLKIENLTQEILLGPAFRLLKGTRSNYAELEYDFEECYKALSEKLDWENPEGGDYTFDLSKPLPLITRGNRQRVPFEFIINNDLKYLQGGISTMTYTMSTTKTMAAQGMQSRGDVYSTKRILVVTHVSVMRKHGYGYLEEIIVRLADNILYKFKEGDFPPLQINDIEDMLILVVRNWLTNLSGDDVADFAIALRMFTRSLVIQKRVEDLQLGVESYQKKINVTKPDTTRPDLRKRHPYTPYKDPQGFIYVDDHKRNRHNQKYRHGVLAEEKMEQFGKEKSLFHDQRHQQAAKGKKDDEEFGEIRWFDTLAGNPVKEILLKLNLPDHRILKDGGEVLKLKNFKKDATLKLFKSTNQERCSRSHSRQAKEQAQDLKSMITTSNHKIND
ncbi:hypothetical protein Tco_0818057 [Tanacetum coccineum]